MGALLNYVTKAGLVNAGTVDEEQAVRQLQQSINEMVLGTSQHHAGLRPKPYRRIQSEIGAAKAEKIQALFVRAKTD
jgi:hypothetical protein